MHVGKYGFEPLTSRLGPYLRSAGPAALPLRSGRNRAESSAGDVSSMEVDVKKSVLLARVPCIYIEAFPPWVEDTRVRNHENSISNITKQPFVVYRSEYRSEFQSVFQSARNKFSTYINKQFLDLPERFRRILEEAEGQMVA